MSYTTGVAVSTTQVLYGIKTGAIAAGWTLAYEGPDTGGGTLTGFRANILWMTNGTYCLGFSFDESDASINEIQCYWASSFNGSLQYTQQANFKSLFTQYAWIPGEAWHVFASTDNIYVVIESQPELFRHFGGGSLIKQDNYVGGGFLYSHRIYAGVIHSQPMAYLASGSTGAGTYAVRLTVDGSYSWRDNAVAPFLRGPLGANMLVTDVMGDRLITAQANQFNLQTILVPVYTTITRADSTQSPIGYPPNVRVCNILALPNSGAAGATITLGPDTWMIFPVGKQNAGSAIIEAEGYGLAYKVV